MKQCHVCLFMCEDDAEVCPVCGAELRSEQETAGEPSGEIENPVLAQSVDSPVTAEIFTDMLSENGIAYSVDEKGDIMHVGFGGSYFAVDVYVDEKDLDAAKDIYRSLSENPFGVEDFDGEEDGEDGEV